MKREPMEVRPLVGGKVGLTMKRSCAYLMLSREQALRLALAILRAVRW